MRQRNRSGSGKRRGKAGSDEPDLFGGKLSAAVQKAFAAELETSTAASEMALRVEPEERLERVEVGREPTRPAPGLRSVEGDAGTLEDRAELEEPVARQEEPLPARMLNEFVYCPRLFYYEHVEGVFVENADTLRGTALHERVDKGKGGMPKKRAKPRPEAAAEATGEGTTDHPAAAVAEPEIIHARSVTLGSDRLGVVAKMDLVETTLDADGETTEVCPVDYKAGSPREGEGGLELWDTDRMQLGLQGLILRDNGYNCHAGIIYYRGTKQRVRLEITSELEAWVVGRIAAARQVAAGPIPAPLIDSPKCIRCSLAPVCLPDETLMLATQAVESLELRVERSEESEAAEPNREAQTAKPSTLNPPPSTSGVRRLMAARDDKRALYLNTPGYRIGCNDAVLKVKEKDRVVDQVRVMDVSHVALFGNIQLSTQAVQRLCDHDIPVTWFSMGGWFYGITRGHSLKNVLLRIEQFRHAADPASCLRLARQFVRGKIHNHRVLFMRNHTAPPESTKLRLGQARADALAAGSLETLLGVEGAAAAAYFREFDGLIRREEEDDFLEGLEPAEGRGAARDEVAFRFGFHGRNRRPPVDPVNAMLSLAYSLLAKECTLAALAVGLDPYVGFYHQPRHGRPALALDVMEEFRPIIAESAVLIAINNRFVSPQDFVTAGRAVNLSPTGRKKFFQCFEQRINSTVTHPVFDYKVSYRRAIELQFRILARVLTGEVPEYVPFLSR